MELFGAKCVITYSTLGANISSDISFTPFEYFLGSLAPLVAGVIPLIFLVFKIFPIFFSSLLILIVSASAGDFYAACYCLMYFNKDVLFEDYGHKFIIFQKTNSDQNFTL